jgi:hypothetical protein
MPMRGLRVALGSGAAQLDDGSGIFRLNVASQGVVPDPASQLQTSPIAGSVLALHPPGKGQRSSLLEIGAAFAEGSASCAHQMSVLCTLQTVTPWAGHEHHAGLQPEPASIGRCRKALTHQHGF